MRQMLDRDLEDSEEQYQMALRSHLLIVDALVDLQYSRVKSLEETFDASLHTLEDEFDTERTEMVNAHHRQKKDLLDMMAAMDHEFTEAENEARQEYESQVCTRAPGGRERWTPSKSEHSFWHCSELNGGCALNPGMCRRTPSLILSYRPGGIEARQSSALGHGSSPRGGWPAHVGLLMMNGWRLWWDV